MVKCIQRWREDYKIVSYAVQTLCQLDEIYSKTDYYAKTHSRARNRHLPTTRHRWSTVARCRRRNDIPHIERFDTGGFWRVVWQVAAKSVATPLRRADNSTAGEVVNVRSISKLRDLVITIMQLFSRSPLQLYCTEWLVIAFDRHSSSAATSERDHSATGTSAPNSLKFLFCIWQLTRWTPNSSMAPDSLYTVVSLTHQPFMFTIWVSWHFSARHRWSLRLE